MTESEPTTTTPYRPLFPEAIDQGDPFIMAVPPAAGSRFRFYVYASVEAPADGRVIPVYGSPDLRTWERLGDALRTEHVGAHWAPCVRYVPGLARPFVMLYSRAQGVDEEAHIGHTLRRADAAWPEGPFVDSGHLLTPDLDFAIDPDVYRLADGSLRCAFAIDFVADEPYGTGIVEAAIDEALTELRGARRILARPRHDWHVYDPARTMPWKTIPGVDWARQSVRWHTVEAPVGGLVSPAGTPVYLYSGGCFWGFYAVGTLVEGETGLHDVTDGERNFVIRPDPAAGFYGPGHCSHLRAEDGAEYLMLHARFGAPDAPRQMCLARLRWTEDGLPYAEPVP